MQCACSWSWSWRTHSRRIVDGWVEIAACASSNRSTQPLAVQNPRTKCWRQIMVVTFWICLSDCLSVMCHDVVMTSSVILLLHASTQIENMQNTKSRTAEEKKTGSQFYCGRLLDYFTKTSGRTIPPSPSCHQSYAHISALNQTQLQTCYRHG